MVIISEIGKVILALLKMRKWKICSVCKKWGVRVDLLFCWREVHGLDVIGCICDYVITLAKTALGAFGDI